MIISNKLNTGYKVLTDIFNCYEYSDKGYLVLQEGFKYKLVYENHKYDSVVDLTKKLIISETDTSDTVVLTDNIDTSLIAPSINDIEVGYTIIGACTENSIIEVVLPDGSIKQATTTDNYWILKTKTLLLKDQVISVYSVSRETGKYSIPVKKTVGSITTTEG